MGGELDLTIFAVIGISAIMLPIFFRESISEFSYIQKSVYLVGCGGVLIFFGALVSFATVLPEDKLSLWPLIIVIGVPLLLCYTMFSVGIESSRKLSQRGFVAGILPEGISELDYQDLVSEDKTFVEENRNKAVLHIPLYFFQHPGR